MIKRLIKATDTAIIAKSAAAIKVKVEKIAATIITAIDWAARANIITTTVIALTHLYSPDSAAAFATIITDT